MKEDQNKMGIRPIPGLLWRMGLPMIVSMILQSVYNIVDTAFVINMGEDGQVGNLALTYAFPIQLLIIAVGVGTGIGINAILSKSLGERNREKVSRIAGNGIFLGLCIYAVFLVFGLFGSRWFISIQALGNQKAIDMGTEYLTICSCFSFGAIGYTIYERFLQATGKTMHSTVAQIAGAVTNIVLDYVFIFPCGMGIAGAAWATVIGQILSLAVAMALHYGTNKEIGAHIRYIRPAAEVIGNIYKIGGTAAVMQGLLSVMMLGMNLILGTAARNADLLQGSFGVYYKIMQFALFAAFGISNTIITVLSFNYGMKDRRRVGDCIRYGVLISATISLIITVLFEIFAPYLARLFGIGSASGGNDLTGVVVKAIRIGAIGYVFMGISVDVQGVLQAFRCAVKPLLISLLRLAVLVFPVAFLFTLSDNAVNTVWWTFPIVEFVTAGVSLLILRTTYRKIAPTLNGAPAVHNTNLIVTVSREHGSNGKYIARLVAEKTGFEYYDKTILTETARATGLARDYIDELSDGGESFYRLYLGTEVNRDAIVRQAEVIRSIAGQKDCVIVGRGADFILKDYANALHIFIYADPAYRIATIERLYGDTEEAARKNMVRSDNARSQYYSFISGRKWGDKTHYDLCIDASAGPEATAEAIVRFIRQRQDGRT